jgi:tetratricopeptide (TPR) repeat protein
MIDCRAMVGELGLTLCEILVYIWQGMGAMRRTARRCIFTVVNQMLAIIFAVAISSVDVIWAESYAQETSSFVAQIASLRSRDAANAIVTEVRTRYPGFFREIEIDIEEVNLGAKGLWYRVNIGPGWPRARAQFWCDQFKLAGHSQCLLVPAQPWQAEIVEKCGEGRLTIVSCAELIRVDPSNATAYLFRAKRHVMDRNWNQAIADLTKVVMLQPNLSEAFQARGLARVKQRRYDEAIRDMTEAVNLDPNLGEAFRIRGIAYLELQQTEKAIDDLTRAIAINPGDAEAYNARGEAFEAKGSIDLANSDYRNTVAVEQNFYNQHGHDLEKTDYDRAMVAYSRGLKFHPASAAFYHHSRAELYAAKGEDDKALAEYIQAAQLEPANSYITSALGYAYYFKADFRRAAEHLGRALELSKTDVSVIFFLYLARARAGDQDAKAGLLASGALPTFTHNDNDKLVFELLADKQSPEDILKAPVPLYYRCEVNFFLGQWYILRAELGTARKWLQQAVEVGCRHQPVIHSAALADLKRMK